MQVTSIFSFSNKVFSSFRHEFYHLSHILSTIFTRQQNFFHEEFIVFADNNFIVVQIVQFLFFFLMERNIVGKGFFLWGVNSCQSVVKS